MSLGCLRLKTCHSFYATDGSTQNQLPASHLHSLPRPCLQDSHERSPHHLLAPSPTSFHTLILYCDALCETSSPPPLGVCPRQSTSQGLPLPSGSAASPDAPDKAFQSPSAAEAEAEAGLCHTCARPEAVPAARKLSLSARAVIGAPVYVKG